MPPRSEIISVQPYQEDLGYQKLLATPFSPSSKILVTEDERYPADKSWQKLLSTTLDLASKMSASSDERAGDQRYQRLLTTYNPSSKMSASEDPSRPFVDTLYPYTVGSDARVAALNAAKIKTTETLPTIFPLPGALVSVNDVIFIPCGDRIPEWFWTNVDDPQAQSQPRLNDNKTIFIVNGVVAYRDGSGQNGWTVTKEVNDINGYNYELDGPSSLPLGDVTVQVHLEGVNSFDGSFNFETTAGDPEIYDNSPTGTGVLVGSNIYFSTKENDGVGISKSSILSTISGSYAIIGGVFQAGFDGLNSSITANAFDGYDIIIDPTTDLNYNETIDAYAYCEAIGGNSDFLSWSFTTEAFTFDFTIEDYEPPVIYDNYPTGSYNPRSTNILFSTKDEYGSGVDSNTIDATVGGIDAIIDGVFQTGFDGPNSSIIANVLEGYDVVIDPSSDLAGSLIDVYSYCEDFEGNLDSLTWSFSILEPSPPFLRNETPTSTISDRSALISVDILDENSDILLNTIDAYVNGALVFSGPSTFYPTYDGTSSNIATTVVDGYDGYHLVLDNTNLFTVGSSYTVRVTCLDAYGNSLDDSFSFDVEAILTSITNVEPILYEITLDVTFDTPMLENEDLENPANYQFDNGMYARKVDIIASNKVRLWVELFSNNDLFTLTADSNIRNAYGYGFAEGGDEYGVAPFQSSATFSNYNGMIRTWHESTFVTSDSKRIYLAGIKGIDVFRRLTSTGFDKWAQILDEYGIDSMCVQNYPTDLDIEDTDPPELTDRDPAPLFDCIDCFSIATTDTHITFKIVDIITSVIITTVRVYVDGDLVFNGGYGGWQEGWSGVIDVEHQQLLVDIWPDNLFSPGNVTVRVVAQDLLGNEMDSTYVFYVVTPASSYGFASFGLSPF